MIKYLPVLIFLWIFIACESVERFPADDCLGEVALTDDANCPSEWPDDKICETRFSGQFVLSEKSKSYLPMYCDTIGTKIVYTNGVGDDQVFELLGKGYNQTFKMVAHEDVCSDGTDRRTIYCIESEAAYVQIKSDQHQLILEIATLPDDQDPTIGNVGDYFTILREFFPESDMFVQEWSSVIDRRTLSYSMKPCRQFFPSITLNGRLFENVTGFMEQEDCANYRYYINQDYGLVGFSRSDGVLWSLK